MLLAFILATCGYSIPVNAVSEPPPEVFTTRATPVPDGGDALCVSRPVGPYGPCL